MITRTLEQQLAFLAEIDKLKSVVRQTVLMDGSRRENSAEHSWHVVVMAMVLAEYAAEPVDLLKVMKMLAIHDTVEVYAGDTFIYDESGTRDQEQREQAAADQLFTLLPARQADDFRSLWDEFETGATADAKYAKAIDRIQPVFQNLASRGVMWRRHGITIEQIRSKVQASIERGAPELWPTIADHLQTAQGEGWLQ